MDCHRAEKIGCFHFGSQRQYSSHIRILRNYIVRYWYEKKTNNKNKQKKYINIFSGKTKENKCIKIPM